VTESIRGRARIVAGLFASPLLAAACTSGSAMAIDLVLPEDPALSPDGDRVAQLTLVTWEAGQPPRSQTRAVDDPSEGLDMGALAAGREVGVAVELRSATQRLLGYGASPLPVEAGDDTVVTLQVRRPYIYAAGSASQLDTFDSTLDPGDEGTFGGVAVAAPIASAPTADGAELVVISTSGDAAELRLVSTATHQPLDGAVVPITGAVSDLAVTADGSLALIAHGGEAGGLSVVDLAAAREGLAAVETVDIGPVGGLAVAEPPEGPARAIALLDRSRAFGCDTELPASSLVVVELSAGLPVGEAIELPVPIADLAADADTVYLADPCGGSINRLALDGSGAPEVLFSLEAATAVAVQGARVWGAGSQPLAGSDGARVVLTSSDGEGASMTRVSLPPAQERARSTDFEGEDQRVEVVIEADRLRPFELVALPGGDLVALLTEGYFHSEEWTDVLGSPVVSEIELTTFEYLLVQASSRALVHRVRTFCDGTAVTGATLDDFECGAGSD